MTEFTDGPWAQFVDQGRVTILPAMRPGEIATVPLAGSGAANAHLIAAAPDLYAALAEARDQFRWYVELHDAKAGDPLARQKAERNAEMARKCDAALAKARGETP